MPRSLRCCIILAGIAGPAWPWGEDGHKLILQAALQALPLDGRRLYEGRTRELNRLVVEPDRHSSAVPAEGCKHWINIEKFDPAYITDLRTRLGGTFGDGGWADEDGRALATAVDQARFRADPPPWPTARTAALWADLPATIEAFRQRYGRLEVLVGSVVYQPFLYTRALTRAIRADDRRRVLQCAGYLAHYVGDLHVPVHVSANFRGQYSGHLLFEDKERGDPHARFETGFVKDALSDLGRAVRARRRPPSRIPLGQITSRSVAAARDSYEGLPRLLEADRSACLAADPRHDWEGYLRAVDGAFRPLAVDRLAAASAFLADLFLTAAAPSGSVDDGVK